MIATMRKIGLLLNERERRYAIVVLILTLISTVFEIIGIASILPFIAVLATPEIIDTNEWLNRLFTMLGFQTSRGFLIFLGIGVMAILFVSNAIKALARWTILRFTIMTGHTISARLFAQYLAQPYSYFLHVNSAQLSKNILQEIHVLVTKIMFPLAEVITRAFTILAIIAFLMFVDPLLAFVSGIILGGAFAAIYIAMRRWLLIIGQDRATVQQQRYRIVNEAFAGVKNI